VRCYWYGRVTHTKLPWQYFKPNPYFTDSVLKKEYKYVPPPAASDEQPDADGITDSMLDFSWIRDVQPSVSSCCSREVLPPTLL
jgi:hypothetical protein